MLPINIEQLLHGQTVEWERLEFKKGWNPPDILHTICAFANDINNWGGGYIVIGIEEKNGRPLFPPCGLSSTELDTIQKKLIEYGQRLRPYYHPVVCPTVYQERQILILWCPGGPTRPYQVPKDLSKQSQYEYYIRKNSTTAVAKVTDVARLHQMANQIPFDDQINHHANIHDLKLPIIKNFLKDVGSELYDSADELPFETLCRQLQIVRGPDEYLMPINVGLLMFNEKPANFFPDCRIEIVEFMDSVGDRLSEKIFSGPIHTQLQDALRYIERTCLKEEVQKIPRKAKSERFFNYPFVAIDEALANAVYHRDYQKREPIEVRILPDAIEIQSFPGPMPPVTVEELNSSGRAKVREYRNRRIGDFLKELRLTEGRCTGIPKIQHAMVQNGSPPAHFETDQDLTYFLTTLPIHPQLKTKAKSTLFVQASATKKGRVSSQFIEKDSRESTLSIEQKLPVYTREKLDTLGRKPEKEVLRQIILELCAIYSLSAQELAKLLNKKSKKALVRDHLTPMRKSGLLIIENPKEKASNQKYRAEKMR